MNVTKGTPTLTGTVTSLITYGDASDYYGSESNIGDSDCTYELLRNGSSIDSGSSVSDTTVLGADVYNYTYYTTGCDNWTAGSDTDILTVNKATPTGSLTITDSTWTYTYPKQVTVSYSESNSVDGGCTYKVWRDDSDKGSGETDITLGVGSYEYKLNTTGCTNFSATDDMDTQTMTVEQNTTTTCTIASSNGWSYTYGAATTLTCTCEGDGTSNLYYDGLEHNEYNDSSTVFAAAPGGVEVICNMTATTNYTAESDSNTLTIAKASNPVNLYLNTTLNDNETYTYPEAVNATGTSTVLTPSLYRDGVSKGTSEQILLSNGTYAYKVNATGNENYSDNSTGLTYYALVNKGSSSVSIALTNNNTDYGLTNIAECSLVTGDSSATLTLYRNQTITNTGTSPIDETTVLPAGLWNYTCAYSTSENYSSSTSTSWMLISKAKPNITLSNNTAEVNTSGLVGYWKLDEGIGNTTYDASGWDNDGTLQNSTHGVPTWTEGRFGQGLEFDGEGDYVEIQDSNSLGSMNELTVEGWAKLNEFSGGEVYPIIGKVQYGNAYEIVFHTGVDGIEFCVANDTDWDCDNSGDIDIQTNAWYHVVGTYLPNGTGKIYVNGTLVNSFLFTVTGVLRNDSNSVIIGKGNDAVRIMNGTIDEVRVWNRTLSSDEIKEIYQSSVTYGTQTNFSVSENNANDINGAYMFRVNNTTNTLDDYILYWSFDEIEGSIVHDASESNSDARLYPTPTTTSSMESTSDFTGTSLSLDYTEKKDGTYSLKDTVSSPSASNTYNISYDPSGTWNWNNNFEQTFWIRNNRSSTDFNQARVYVYDSDDNYRYWDIDFSSDNWENKWLYMAYMNGYGGKDNSNGGSNTTITNCESITDWSKNNTGGSSSISIVDSNREGDYYVRFYVYGDDLSTNTDYYFRYNPTGNWDWSSNSYLHFMMSHCVPCEETDYLRLYAYDTSGDWAYWDLGCQYANWKAYALDLSSPTDEAPGALDLSTIDYIQWDFNRSDLSRYYQHINLDWIRLDDLHTEKVDKIIWSLEAADTTPFTTNIDMLQLDNDPNATQGKFGKALELDKKEYVRSDSLEPLVNGNNLTMTAWFKPDVSELNSQSWLFYKRWGYSIGVDSVYGTCYDQSGGKGQSISSITWENKWYFAVFRIKQESSTDAYDGVFDIQLYDENGLVGSNSRSDFGTVADSNTNYWYVGNTYWACFSNEYFDGMVDEFRVYNRTLTDEEIAVLRGAKNSTEYDATILGAGSYYYEAFMPPTQNYTKSSILLPLSVSKATMDLSISGGTTQTYPYQSTVTGTESNSGDSDVTYQLWRDSSMVDDTETYQEQIYLGVGSYAYRFNATGGANWTANATGVTDTVTINQNSSTESYMNLTINGTEGNKSYTYGQASNATGYFTGLFGNVPTFTLYRYYNTSVGSSNPQSDIMTFANETHWYVYNTSGNTNYSSASKSYFINIGKATSSVSISLTNNNTDYGLTDVAECSLVTGDSSATLTLYRNGSQVDTGTTPIDETIVLPAGLWNYTCVYSTSENYSSSTSTSWMLISKAKPNITLSNNTAEVNTSGLVGYWKFDEGIRNITYDKSGNNNTGYLKNQTGVCGGEACPSWTNGKLGKALEYDGIADFVEIYNYSNLNTLGSSDFAVEWWFKTTSSGRKERFISKGSESWSQGWHTYLSVGGNVGVELSDGVSTGESGSTVGSYNDGIWHHSVSVFYFGDNVSIFMDGDFENSFDISGEGDFSNSLKEIKLGRANIAYSENFTGTMDEVRLWNRSLSTGEIKELYETRSDNSIENNFSMSEENTGDSDVYYDFYRNGTVSAIWHFDEGENNYTFDDTGNNNTGTLKNSTHGVPIWSSGCTYGNCLEFDGLGDYIEISNSESLTLEDKITIEAWINWKDEGDDWQGIVSKGSLGYTGTEAWDFGLNNQGGGLDNELVWMDGNGDLYDSSYTITNNEWTHVAISVDNNTGSIKFYINGLENEFVSSNAMGSYDRSITIGSMRRLTNGDSFFNGTIDEVKIYPRVLSAEEILCRAGNNCSDYNLWNDTTTLDNSYYYYTARASEGENYTSSSLQIPLYIGEHFLNSSQIFSLDDETGRLGEYNRNPLQGFTLTETSGRLSDIFRTITDYFTTTFSMSRLGSFVREITDSLSLNNIAERIASIIRNVYEILSFDSAIERGFSFLRITADSFGIENYANRLVTFSRIVTDTLSLENFAGRLQYLITEITETLSIENISNRILSAYRTATDSFGIDSIADRLTATLRSVVQSFGISDSADRLTAMLRIIGQDINLGNVAERLSSIFRSITDTLQLSDAVSRGFSFVRSVTESFQIENISQRLSTMLRLLSETIGLQNSANRLVEIQRLLTESLGINNAAQRITSIFRIVTDSFGISEASERLASIFRSIADSIAINAASSRLQEIIRTVTDSFGLGQATERGFAYLRDVFETFSIENASGRLATMLRQATQNIALNNLAGRLQSITQMISQALSLNDYATRIATGIRSVTSYFSASSSSGLVPTYIRMALESLGITDAANNMYAYLRIIFDTITFNLQTIADKMGYNRVEVALQITLNESVSRLSSIFRAITQQLSVSNVSQELALMFRQISDFFSIENASSRLALITRNATETLNISNLASRLQAILRTLGNILQFNESASRLMSAFRSATDSITMQTASERMASILRILSDSINVSNVSERFASIFRNIFDTISFNSGIFRGFVYFRSISDTFSISDATGQLYNYFRMMSEQLGINNVADRIQDITRYFAQTINVNNISERFAIIMRSVTDFFGIDSAVDRLTAMLLQITESFGMSDSASRLADFYRTATGYFGISDSASRLQLISRMITDSFDINEVSNRIFTIIRSVSDSIGIENYSTRFASVIRSITQQLSVNEISQRLTTMLRGVYDTLTFESNIFRGFSYFRDVIETINISDASNQIYSYLRTITQQLNLNVLSDRLQDITIQISQTISIENVSSRLQAIMRTVSDSLGIESLVERTTAMLLEILESFGLQNNASRLSDFYRTATGYFGINEGVSRLQALTRILADSFNINELSSRISIAVRSVTNPIGLSDYASRLQAIIRQISQSITAQNLAARLQALTRVMSESFGISSGVSRGFVYIREIIDSLIINNASQRLMMFSRTLQQSISINEIASRIQAITLQINQSLDISSITGRIISAIRSATDSFGFQSTVDRTLATLINVIQQITTSDYASRLSSITRSVSETLNTNAIVSRLQSLFIRISETFNIGDSVTRNFVYIRDTIQALGISDAANRLMSFTRNIADSIYLNEFAARTQSILMMITEQINVLTDVSISGRVYERIVSVVMSVTDSVSRYRTLLVNITEALNVNAFADRIISLIRIIAEWFGIVATGGPDLTPPEITVEANSILPLSDVTIEANVTDAGGVSTVIAQVTYPAINGTVANYSMSPAGGDTWDYTLSNLTEVGDYYFTVFANDSSNNWGNESGWFEVYVPAWFNGTSVDAESYPVDVSFDMFNTTGSLLDSFESNASGYYSNIAHMRYYDVGIGTLNNAVNLSNVSIASDIDNATLIDPLSTFLIGGANSRVAKALYFQTILNYTDATLIMNYTGTGYSSETSLGIYRCENWLFSNRTPATDNSCWTRLSSTLDIFNNTLTTSMSEISGAYAVAEFICGDGACESLYGETSAFCPADCGTTPTGPTGGSPGGGSAPTTTVEEKDAIQTDITLTTRLIEVRLYPGEYQLVSIGLTNKRSVAKQVKLSVDGAIWPYTMFEDDTLDIQAGETVNAKIKFTTMPTTIPGVYNGKIKVEYDGVVETIDVILRVEYEREKLLDLKVDAITKEVRPGGILEYQVTIYNLGMTKRVDIINNYTIKSTETQEILTVDEESIAVETSTTFVRRMRIPEDTALGLYVLEAVASYDDKIATSVTSFSVVDQPWIITFLIDLFTNWMTYIVLFVAIPSFLLGWKLFEKWHSQKRVRGRYVRPVKLNKLPKKGLLLGKIAETNTNAYIEEEKLTTHTIIAGGTGSGKTVAAMVMAEEALKKNIPVIVFDPTAQWTGFIRSNNDKEMINNYKKFGMKEEEARSFKGSIVPIKDPFLKLEIEKYVKPGEMTVFVLNKLTADQLDYFIRKTVDYMFKVSWPESRKMKLMVVFDEVHRLLPKYSKKSGASLEGGGYQAIERACREFRKWGIGLVMISQVLLDFKGAIRAVIATEMQLRTKYEGDVNRIKTKYGWDYAESIPKLDIGTGMVQNPSYNDGKPWFITFRPLLHDTFRLTDEELQKYEDYADKIKELAEKVEKLKSKGIDTYDMELELKLAGEKVKTGQMRMAETYIDSINTRLKSMEEK
ncbi:MAG: DUF87 domain-containing protein [Candidatus Aenigmarchaeota archaeon]|nr:DUF87 domain-containing protein [Candidatus Aenigmarchaeota archaeon]